MQGSTYQTHLLQQAYSRHLTAKSETALDPPERTEKAAIAISILLSAAIFTADLMLPLGVAGGVPYIAVVLVAMWAPSPRFIYITAVSGTLLTIAGFYLSPLGGVLWVVVFNRVLAIFAIWVTAILAGQRMAAAWEIKKEKEKVQNLLEVAGVMLVAVAADEKVILINKMGCAIVGRDEEAVVGKNWFDNFIPEVARAGERSSFQKLISSQPQAAADETYPYSEQPVLTADGPEKIIAWRKTTLRGSDDTAYAVLYSGEDLTERLLIEDSLKKEMKRTAEATRLKDRFISLVTHDLKSPLTAILTYMKTLQLREETLAGVKDALMLERIIGAAETMSDLITELMEMARLKTEIMQPNMKFINARRLVYLPLQGLSYLADKKGVKLVNNIPENFRIYADPNLAQVVIQNLIANSIKFSVKGDTIALFVPVDEPATIAVFDTGMGIDPDRFEALFRYEEHTSTPGSGGEKGMGLGLPICREIMEAHGGELRVVSASGEGCTFFAAFPRVAPRVLLVAINADSSPRIVDQLKSYEAEVELAGDAKEAMAMIAEKPPHLTIMEQKASGENGSGLAGFLERDGKLIRIPLIVASPPGGNGFPGIEDRENVHLIESPVTPAKLTPLLNKIIA